ncbi:MAG: PQQ-binding-like beta-propeller repeat protein [Planctomycetota bacterium]
MWRKIVVLLLAAAAQAEPDGAIAHPLRWSDPNGTAAGTRRSACLPLTDDVEEAWSVKLPGVAVSPIVYWEREAVVACRTKSGYQLVAIDVLRGKVSGKKSLPKNTPRPLPVLWDNRVFVRGPKLELHEYTRAGRSFNRIWTHKPAQEWLSDPIIHENEIYVVADGNLVRLQPRRRSPVWQAGTGRFRGRPALYGDQVYVLGESIYSGAQDSMHVFVFDRRDGRSVLAKHGAWYAGRSLPAPSIAGSIMISEKDILIRGPTGFATRTNPVSHLHLDRIMDRSGTLAVGRKEGRLVDSAVAPALTPHGVLFMYQRGKELAWVVPRRDHYRQITSREQNPDLFSPTTRVAPTVLGDIVYFGTWAADIGARRVLWRLPLKSLQFPAVPRDQQVLVLDENTHLRAFRGKGR